MSPTPSPVQHEPTGASPREQGALPGREPLRIRLSATSGLDRLDGAWWPQTGDLGLEVADLVDHFPAAVGRVARLSLAPGGWDRGRGRVPTARGGFVKVGSSPRDQSGTAMLVLMDRRIIQLAVVPPSFSAEQGDAVLESASRAGNRRSAISLLGEEM